jgi:hypothetical protein
VLCGDGGGWNYVREIVIFLSLANMRVCCSGSTLKHVGGM